MNAGTVIPIALSVVAIGLAAVSLTQETEAPTTPKALRSTDDSLSRETEEILREVNTRLLQIEERLAQLEARPANASLDSNDPAARLAKDGGRLDEDIAAAVDSALEKKGVEWVKEAQREAKTQGAREGMSKWVSSMEENLPMLHRGIQSRMKLNGTRRGEVTDIIDEGFERMSSLTDELFADPPPSEMESFQIMGEVKETVSEIVEDLDVVLNDEELIQLGQVAVDSGLRGLGQALFEEGKDNDGGEGQ